MTAVILKVFCCKSRDCFRIKSRSPNAPLMNHKITVIIIANFLSLFGSQNTLAQKSLSNQEFVSVAMDLQGILDLGMTSDQQVDFVFNSISKYQVGITKYNATRLEVTATVPWDLYAQPATQYWVQQTKYGNGSQGQDQLPSEILEMQAIQPNVSTGSQNFNQFIGLSSNFGTNTASLTPSKATQFLAGACETGANARYIPGVSESSPLTNKFLVHYRIRPGLPTIFPDLAKQYPSVSSSTFSGSSFTQPGLYQLEVVFTLAEDL